MAASKAALKSIKQAIDASQFKSAAEQAKDLLNKDPDNYFGNVFLGRALEKCGDSDGAAAALVRATELKSDDELPWKGLCGIYESQGSAKVDEHTKAIVKLTTIFIAKDDYDQAQATVDKMISFAKQNGTRKQHRTALRHLLPSETLWQSLGDRIQSPGITYEQLATFTEVDEKERINKQIGERRTRLGAKLDQVSSDVKRELYEESDLEQLYTEVINWTRDDELRRSYEEKLLQRSYDHLLVLPPKLKAQKLSQVQKLANEMVLIDHPYELAWDIVLEWADLDDLSNIDLRTVGKYMKHFPLHGKSKIFRAYYHTELDVDEAVLESEQDDQKASDSGQAKSEKPAKKLPSFEERLLLLIDGIQNCRSSALAYRILAHQFISIGEYESVVENSRQSIALLNKYLHDFGLTLQDTMDSVSLDLGSALIYYQSPRNHDESGHIFREILSRRPKVTEALLGVGLILEEEREFGEAASFLQQALSADRSNLRISAELAWCRGMAGDMEDGIQALEVTRDELATGQGEDLKLRALVNYRLGYLQWELHRDAKYRKNRKGAYAQFVASIKLNPEFAPAYTSLGIYYTEYAGDPRRARQCFQRALELSPVEVLAAHYLAEDFARASEWDLVEIVAQRVIDSGAARKLPGSKREAVSWPYAALGSVQLNRQEYVLATKSFQAALRTSPLDYDSWVGLGEAYLHSGRHIAARRSLEKALTFEEKETWFAQYMLANVFLQTGDFSAAIDGYRRILIQRPGEQGVQSALLAALVDHAQLLISQGTYTRAANEAQDAIKLAVSMPHEKRSTFNFWKIIGCACDVFDSISVLADRLPKENLAAIFQGVGEDLEKIDESVRLDLRTVFESSSGFDACSSASMIAQQLALAHALEKPDSLAIAYYNVGCVYYRLSVSDRKERSPELPAKAQMRLLAVRCIKRAIELEAKNTDFWNALGIAVAEQNPQVAQHSFIRSLHLNERNPSTWTNLGVFYMSENDYELAHQAFTRAQSTDPEHAAAWVGEGLIALVSGDAEEALLHFTHAVEIAGSCVLAFESRYVVTTFADIFAKPAVWKDPSNFVTPTSSLQRLTNIASEASVYRYMLALLQERQGIFDAATSHLEEVAKTTEAQYEQEESSTALSLHMRVVTDLARCQLATSNFEGAAENATLALDLSTDAEDGSTADDDANVKLSAHLTLGLAQSFQGNSEAAVESFRNSIEVGNADPDIICLLSLVLWSRNEDEARNVAKEQLFDILDRNPEHPATTILLGAISIVDDDEELREQVSNDLRSLRASTHASERNRLDADKLLRALLVFDSREDESFQTKERNNAQDAIMTAPMMPQGWLSLGRYQRNEFAIVMAQKTAELTVPPHGLEAASSLAETYRTSDDLNCIQRAIMLCPDDPRCWKALGAVGSS